jgi:nucleotide-binding universal stress UspA family protein
MSTIIVGLDGSSGSQAAAGWAANIARETGAEIVAVHALPRSELWTLAAFQVDPQPIVDELQELLDGRWTAGLRKAGITYTTRVVRGDPATELLRVAKRLEATMLVLGAKRRSAVHDLVVGGTVHKIINRSPVPVVLVPALRRAKKGQAAA